MAGAGYQTWWDLHDAARTVLNRRYARSSTPRVKIVTSAGREDDRTIHLNVTDR